MRLLPVCQVLCMLIAIIFVACSRVKPQEQREVITVTIPAQQWLLQQIVGNRFKVQSMLSPGSNPETFEPSIKQLMMLENSRAFIVIGMEGFEQETLERVKENFPDMPVFTCSEGISRLEHSHGHGHEQNHSAHHSDAASGDPHIWTSPRNARIMAANMLDAVVTLDPIHKEEYRARFNKLDRRLAALDDSITRALAPLRGATFIVWHPSLSYFAHDYGLNQLAMEHDGKEASAAQLRHNLDEARRLHPRVFFLQKEYDSRQAQALAEEAGLPVRSISLMQPDLEAQAREITSALNDPSNR